MSVYSDPRVIAATGDFVCAADEVWRLQRGSEADCLFFQRMVTGGDRITDRGTRQGSWVIAPSGKVLARVNTRNVERQLEMMAAGLAAWSELSEDERRIPADANFDSAHRYEAFFPDDGLALERVGRDVTTEGLDGSPGRRWNRDHVWLSRAEATALVGDEPIQEGDAFRWPSFAERLARFHFVDNVGGQTIPYAAEDVTAAELLATVVDVDAGVARFELRGRTAARSDGAWLMPFSEWKPQREFAHGIDCDVMGTATWSAAEQRFTAFQLVAVGRRWGRTENNARGRDVAAGLLSFHVRSTESRIPPAFASVYDAPWLEHPDVANWLLSPAECGLPER